MYKFVNKMELLDDVYVCAKGDPENIFEVGSMFGRFLTSCGFAEVVIQRIMPNFVDGEVF